MAPTNTAELDRHGLLHVTGADAPAFLHAQLTNNIEALGPDRACLAGWCSAKGRLLASFLVVPHEGGHLLQLARELAPAVAKRLSMFVLRSKVKITDASGEWTQYGLWGEGSARHLEALGVPVPVEPFGIASGSGWSAVRLGAERFLLLGKSRIETNATAQDWALEDIRAGIAQVTQATQDLFVPQMVNFERIGALDFKKGCYPGQEVVARSQYRGQMKRRMVRVRAPVPLAPGQDLYSDDFPGQASGIVVNAAGGEALAVLQISTVEARAAVRAEAGGAPLELLPLPYAA